MAGGHLATFSPRSYPDMETQRPWGIAVLVWAYLAVSRPSTCKTSGRPRAATAKYRLPDVAQAAGTDRSQPYVYRALIDHWALYHFVNKTYVLFSRSPKAAKGQFMGQSYPCGVMWAEPDTAKGSHLWITNPAADDNAAEGNKPTGIHTHGVTNFEQELQYRDALLFVFNIPATFRNPYVLGYVPGGYRAVSAGERQIFLHYGSVLVAVTSSHRILWDAKAGIRAPAEKPHEGDSEFRVMATQAVVAIETAAPGEFPTRLLPNNSVHSVTKYFPTLALRSSRATSQRAAIPTVRVISSNAPMMERTRSTTGRLTTRIGLRSRICG